MINGSTLDCIFSDHSTTIPSQTIKAYIPDINTNDVVASGNTDITSGTCTIGASGNKRMILLLAGYRGANSGIVVAKFNNLNMHQLLSKQNIFEKLYGVEVYYLLDKELPVSSGSYNWEARVDGGGDLVANIVYLEHTKQICPSNFASESSTLESIIATPISPDTGGSVRVDCLLGNAMCDDAQLNIANFKYLDLNLSSSIKLVEKSGNNFTSWKGNPGAKILTSFEVEKDIAGNTAVIYF